MAYYIAPLMVTMSIFLSCNNPTNTPEQVISKLAFYTQRDGGISITLNGETKTDTQSYPQEVARDCNSFKGMKFTVDGGKWYYYKAKLLATGQTIYDSAYVSKGSCFSREAFPLPIAYPAGGVLKTTIESINGDRMIFSIDLFVVDNKSKFIRSLNEKNILVESDYFKNEGRADSTYYKFNLDYVQELNQTNSGPYSAAMLFDQSGSLASTDPSNTRLDAAETFLSSVESQDYVHVSAFASNGSIPYELTQYGTAFTHDALSYIPTVRNFKNSVGGGTPLYKSISSILDFTNQNAMTQNKAVVVFTDGEDTDGSTTVDNVISKAQANGVKVFTVGLGNNTSRAELARIANQTGGAFISASDAQYLISVYGSLGNLLRGTGTFYRARFSVQKFHPGGFNGSGWYSTSVKVKLNDGTIVWVPFVVNY